MNNYHSNQSFEDDNNQKLFASNSDETVIKELEIQTLENDTKLQQQQPNSFHLEMEDKKYLKSKFHFIKINNLKKYQHKIDLIKYSVIHIVVISYFAYATYFFIYNENKFNDPINTSHYNTTYRNLSILSDGNITNLYYNSNETNNERCHGRCGFQWCNGYGMLLILYIIIYCGLLYYFVIKPKFGQLIYDKIWVRFNNIIQAIFRNRYSGRIVIGIIMVIIIAVFLFYETRDSAERLISLIAPIIFIILGYVFSKHRSAIQWRTVITGITLQFLLGLFCIRWNIGRQIFQCIGDKLSVVTTYSNEGAKFVYGSKLIGEQVFAFTTLPVIYFFSSVITILYYFGTMQWIVMNVGWALQKLMGTTICESVNSAGNIFLGMSESPFLIRPYIEYLTKSEIHAIMVSGYATVAGSVFAAYISFGAKPAHLITSTVMAAPAALAFAKLYYPETEDSKTKSENIELKKSEDSSVIDAATNGAQSATPIILGIIANLIAFIALMALINGVVNWFGYLVGLDYLTFEWIFSKLFIPLCWCLGVPLEDCNVIAQVIAKKTIVNEFVAFQSLQEFQKAGKIHFSRSVGIATFAICGFANPSSLGIFIGFLSSLCPQQRPNITAVAFRACIVGSIVCFVSASFAGFLLTNDKFSE